MAGKSSSMGKLLTRLFIVILIGLVTYLYVQVVSLQRENKQLSATISRLGSIQAENTRLRLQLSRQPASAARKEQNGDLIATAREHIQNAEQAVGRGDFGSAAHETQQANADLSRAADQASSQSRQAVSSLRAQLQGVQMRAKSIWHQFGG